MNNAGVWSFGGGNENPSEPANIPAGRWGRPGLVRSRAGIRAVRMSLWLLLLSRLGLRGGLPLSTLRLLPALNQPDAQAEAAEIVRSLIDAIVLTPDNGKLRIDLHGELAGILALAADGKKPDRVRSGLEQIKMVAGTRNQRYLPALRTRIPRIARLSS